MKKLLSVLLTVFLIIGSVPMPVSATEMPTEITINFDGTEFTGDGKGDAWTMPVEHTLRLGSIAGGPSYIFNFEGSPVVSRVSIEVYENATLRDGTFNTAVNNNKGIIDNGTFSEYVGNTGGTINNGVFSAAVYNQRSSTINYGVFTGTVKNIGESTINGGYFSKAIESDGTGTIATDGNVKYLADLSGLEYISASGAFEENYGNLYIPYTGESSTTELTLTATEGYTLPESVTVNGETVTVTDGKITVNTNIPLVISGSAVAESKDITLTYSYSTRQLTGEGENKAWVQIGTYGWPVLNAGYTFDFIGNEVDKSIDNNGTIRSGSFAGYVTNAGTISGGYFTKDSIVDGGGTVSQSGGVFLQCDISGLKKLAVSGVTANNNKKYIENKGQCELELTVTEDGYDVPENVTVNGETVTVTDGKISVDTSLPLTIKGTAESKTITLTYSADTGEFTGNGQGRGWYMNGDTLVLNETYRFKFEGSSVNKNIDNYGSIDMGIIDGDVHNYPTGKIGMVVFRGTVTNEGDIGGGYFYNKIQNVGESVWVESAGNVYYFADLTDAKFTLGGYNVSYGQDGSQYVQYYNPDNVDNSTTEVTIIPNDNEPMPEKIIANGVTYTVTDGKVSVPNNGPVVFKSITVPKEITISSGGTNFSDTVGGEGIAWDYGVTTEATLTLNSGYTFDFKGSAVDVYITNNGTINSGHFKKEISGTGTIGPRGGVFMLADISGLENIIINERSIIDNDVVESYFPTTGKNNNLTLRADDGYLLPETVTVNGVETTVTDGKITVDLTKPITISGAAIEEKEVTLSYKDGVLTGSGKGTKWSADEGGNVTLNNGYTFTFIDDTFDKAVNNDGIISNGTFKNVVTNNATGEIHNGNFTSSTNSGIISGGTFSVRVSNNGKITDGIFDGKVDNYKDAAITGGTFNNEVYNKAGGTIDSGIFNGLIKNSGIINNGIFNGNATNYTGAVINNGTFSGSTETMENFGTINGGILSNEIENTGTIYGGAFHEKVKNGTAFASGTINGGVFSDQVENNSNITAGYFYRAITGSSTVPQDGKVKYFVNTTALNHMKLDTEEVDGESFVPNKGTKTEITFIPDSGYELPESVTFFRGDAVEDIKIKDSKIIVDATEPFTLTGTAIGKITITCDEDGNVTSGENDAYLADDFGINLYEGYIFSFEGTPAAKVTNNGTLAGGTFTNEVENNGKIIGGSFSGQVTNGYSGTITGGDFSEFLTNDGTISGGDFSQLVTNNGTINGGYFVEDINNDAGLVSDNGEVYFRTDISGIKTFNISGIVKHGENIYLANKGLTKITLTPKGEEPLPKFVVANGVQAPVVNGEIEIYTDGTVTFVELPEVITINNSESGFTDEVGGEDVAWSFGGDSLTLNSGYIFKFTGENVTAPINNYGTISSGTFYGDILNSYDAVISGGKFISSVDNRGAVNGGYFDNTITGEGTVATDGKVKYLADIIGLKGLMVSPVEKSSLQTFIANKGENTQLTLTAKEGYTLPDTVTVNGDRAAVTDGKFTVDSRGTLKIEGEGVDIKDVTITYDKTKGYTSNNPNAWLFNSKDRITLYKDHTFTFAGDAVPHVVYNNGTIAEGYFKNKVDNTIGSSIATDGKVKFLLTTQLTGLTLTGAEEYKDELYLPLTTTEKSPVITLALNSDLSADEWRVPPYVRAKFITSEKNIYSDPQSEVSYNMGIVKEPVSITAEANPINITLNYENGDVTGDGETAWQYENGILTLAKGYNFTLEGDAYDMEVNNNGTISDGMFNGIVYNTGTINGGYFDNFISGGGTVATDGNVKYLANVSNLANITIQDIEKIGDKTYLANKGEKTTLKLIADEGYELPDVVTLMTGSEESDVKVQDGNIIIDTTNTVEIIGKAYKKAIITCDENGEITGDNEAIENNDGVITIKDGFSVEIKGEINADVIIDGKLTGGKFTGNVTVNSGALVTDGNFEGVVNNSGTIAGGYFDNIIELSDGTIATDGNVHYLLTTDLTNMTVDEKNSNVVKVNDLLYINGSKITLTADSGYSLPEQISAAINGEDISLTVNSGEITIDKAGIVKLSGSAVKIIEPKNEITDSNTGTKIIGLDGTTFDPATELKIVLQPSSNYDAYKEKIEKLSAGKQVAVLYEVKLVLNGKEIQPNGKIRIEIPLTAEQLAYENPQTIYIDNEGNVSLISGKVENGKLIIETDHLSLYGAIGTKKVTPTPTPSATVSPTPSTSASPAPSATTSPTNAPNVATGDSNIGIIVAIAAAAIALLVAALLIYKKKLSK